MAEKKKVKANKAAIPKAKPTEHPPFERHEDDWVPLVSPHSAPEIIWAVRGKCQHLLTGKGAWKYAWDYLREETHEFWKVEAAHKVKMAELQEEMKNPKYNGKRKDK